VVGRASPDCREGYYNCRGAGKDVLEKREEGGVYECYDDEKLHMQVSAYRQILLRLTKSRNLGPPPFVSWGGGRCHGRPEPRS